MRVSVIIPTRNRPSYLADAIRCLERQQLQPFEIIVVDDGGETPIPRDIRAHPLVKQVVLPHQVGPVEAMNRGARESCGDFMFFMADDDTVTPDFLDRSSFYLRLFPNPAYTFTASRWTDDRGLSWSMPRLPDSAVVDFTPETMARRQPFVPISHSTVVRREAFMDAGRFDPLLKWHCDWWLTVSLMATRGALYLPWEFSNVLIHGHSYYSRRDPQDHADVMWRIARLANGSPARQTLIDSGVLSTLGLPILRGGIRGDFVTWKFLKGVVRREAEMRGRRWLPTWLARKFV